MKKTWVCTEEFLTVPNISQHFNIYSMAATPRKEAGLEQIYHDTIALSKAGLEGVGWGAMLASILPIGLLAARRSRVWSAIMLGLRSRIHRRAATPSVLTGVVDKIRAAVSSREAKGFITVLGEKGVGKTTAIASATERFAICC